MILDHGYVKFIEDWGHGDAKEPEAGIIEAARQSTKGSFRGWEKDQQLLNYLFTNKPQHAGPFEFAGMVIEVQAPIFVFREWHRHRTQCLKSDTLISFETPTTRRVYRMRIDEIWRKWQPSVRNNRPERQINSFSLRNRIKGMFLRCLNEETKEFTRTHINDVICGTPKFMIRISTSSGKTLTATKDHRVFTNDGWMTLGDAISNKASLVRNGVIRGKINNWKIPNPDFWNESWKDVVRWEDLYQVSDQGRVRRLGSSPKKTVIANNGYSVVSLSRNGITEIKTVHTLVLEAFVGVKQKGQEARHKNHNRADARLKNLCWGSSAENSVDMLNSDRNQRLVPNYETIMHVESIGEFPTYDLVVNGPWHNFVADGFVVHNSYNEMSARYAPIPNLNYVPTLERCMLKQGNKNKQAGSIAGAEELTKELASDWKERLESAYLLLENIYQDGLSIGIPKELARCPMPVGRYSRMRASANLRNWLAFLTLRMDPNAQWEIRQYANAVGQIISERFPRTWRLFIESNH